MEQLRETPDLAGEGAALTAPLPTVHESQPQSLLAPAGSLIEQCRGCSNELQRLAEQALEYGEISVYARTILHPIAGQLRDVRLRLDIWMSDIDIEKGTLSESDTFKQSRLFSVITTALQRMHNHLEAVSKELALIRFETELITTTEQRNVSRVKQAEARIADALSAMTSVLRNLADLATSIQMFRAIQTSEGPYSELRAQVSSIKAQPEENLSANTAEVPTGIGGDDEDQCPSCRRWFGLDDLPTHVAECPKAEVQVVPSTQPEPEDPFTTSVKPVGTGAEPSPPHSPQPPTLPPLKRLYARDIWGARDPPSEDIDRPERRRKVAPPSKSDSDAAFVSLSSGMVCADMQRRSGLPGAKNFVLRILSPNSSIAVDVPTRDTVWDTILTSKVHVDAPQWINIWDLRAQRVAVTVLAEFYHFSDRLMEDLLGFMRRPFRPYKTRKVAKTRANMASKSTLGNPKSMEKDVELGEDEGELGGPLDGSRWFDQDFETDNLHSQLLIADSRYTCIAYNRTFGDVTELLASRESTGRLKSREDLDLVRIWLILCHDGTVISMHQKLYREGKDKYSVKDDRTWRMHTLKVLGEASRLPTSTERNGHIRFCESIRQANQGASTLFYHLYDDRRGVFSDVAPIIQQYNWTLDYFQEVVGESRNSLQQVSCLEDFGLGLSELKRSFEASAELIDQILDPPPEYCEVDENSLAKHASLPYPTAMLFLRLRRRINDLCVAKVQRLIDEKEALSRILSHVSPYKQPPATGRLGLAHSIYQRVVVALLCLILMSTYFSNSIDNLKGVYTATTYWVTFTIIVVINAIFLVAYSFGQIRRYFNIPLVL